MQRTKAISNAPPWLSICIPTFNRPYQMERMLKTILPQITPDIELIVRDDSEDKKTKLIAEKLLSECCINYRYFSGQRIGVDSAAIFLLEKAIGKYVWWCSDDDEITSGTIEKLKIITSSKEYAAIWLNFSYNDMGSLAVNRESGLFASPDAALVDLGTNVGLISTQFVNRELALNAINFAKKHVHGFSFASTAIFLYSLGKGPSYFYKGPAIKCNPTEINEIKKITVKDGDINNDGFRVYGEYFRNLIIDLPVEYSSKAKRQSLLISFSSLWRGMLVGWLGGWDSPVGKRHRMFKMYWSFFECWIALALFCMPRKLVASFYKVYKIFYSHRRFIFLDKLRAH